MRSIMLILVLFLVAGCTTLDVKEGELKATSNYNETVAAVAIEKTHTAAEFAHACHGNIPKHTEGDTFDEFGKKISTTRVTTYTQPAVLQGPDIECDPQDPMCYMMMAMIWDGVTDTAQESIRSGADCVAKIGGDAKDAQNVAARVAQSGSVGLADKALGALAIVAPAYAGMKNFETFGDTAQGIAGFIKTAGPIDNSINYTGSYNTNEANDNTTLGAGALLAGGNVHVGDTTTATTELGPNAHIGDRINENNTGLIGSNGQNPVHNEPDPPPTAPTPNCQLVANPDPAAPGTFIYQCSP